MTTDELKEAEVHRVLQIIVDNAGLRSLNWCVNYARYGLGCSGGELRTQCLYVLSNMIYWTGPTAKEVRKVLKKYCEIR